MTAHPKVEPSNPIILSEAALIHHAEANTYLRREVEGCAFETNAPDPLITSMENTEPQIVYVPIKPDMQALALLPRRKVTKICVICQQPFEAVRENAQCCKIKSCRRDYKRMRKANKTT